MKKLRVQFFSIVEVALALAIVGIGVAGIMSLFPVALNASRDSVGDNSAPDVAEQFLSFIEAKAYSTATTDWSTAGFIIADMKDYTSASGSGYFNDDQTDATAWGTTPISNISSKTFGGTTLYKIVQSSGAGLIPDFSGIIRIWKAQIPTLHVEAASPNVPYKYGAALYVEISWPAEKPYTSREKRTYYLELFNPDAS